MLCNLQWRGFVGVIDSRGGHVWKTLIQQNAQGPACGLASARCLCHKECSDPNRPLMHVMQWMCSYLCFNDCRMVLVTNLVLLHKCIYFRFWIEFLWLWKYQEIVIVIYRPSRMNGIVWLELLGALRVLAKVIDWSLIHCAWNNHICNFVMHFIIWNGQ